MSDKISQWIRLIGIVVNIIPFIQPIAIAKTPIVLDRANRSIAISKTVKLDRQSWQVTTIAQNNAPKAVDYIASARQKYEKQNYQGAGRI
jgi:hypothetical protein